jgi:hypothetical protein
MKLVAHSYICSRGAFLNGEHLISSIPGDENYLRKIYSELKLDYPKFYKMDVLSKMALLADALLSDELFVSPDDDLQLIFANTSSSKRTDLDFIHSYKKEGAPSPSLFVYTLPNIVTGELSIRRKRHGENAFFISPEFDPQLFVDQILFSFQRGNKQCLCAWVEANEASNEECFLFLVENDGGQMLPDTLLNVLKSYRNE